MNENIKPLSAIREEYCTQELLENKVNKDPIIQFEKWINEAIDSHVKEPTAMSLCTVSETGRPSNRIVLLKNISVHGLTFFTNYNSKKGRQLGVNPFVAATFFWPELERQVRIEGLTTKVSREETEMYFHSRPRGSQIGAWVSHQSESVSKEALLARLKEEEIKWTDKEIECPPYWGGFLLKPDFFEFWQGRPCRLHDRISYAKETDSWKIGRLSP